MQCVYINLCYHFWSSQNNISNSKNWKYVDFGQKWSFSTFSPSWSLILHNASPFNGFQSVTWTCMKWSLSCSWDNCVHNKSKKCYSNFLWLKFLSHMIAWQLTAINAIFDNSHTKIQLFPRLILLLLRYTTGCYGM